jgi:hypothetical protein
MNEALNDWLAGQAHPNKIPILVLEDLKHWSSFRVQDAPYGVVLAKVDWLDRHGVPCVDVVRDGLHQRRQLITPEIIVKTILAAPEFHEVSVWDKWMQRDNYDASCAGCVRVEACESSPSAGRHCNDYETKENANWVSRYGLGQLIHRCLTRCDEDRLLISPEEIWYSVFDLALSREKGRKSRWIQNYGRSMRGAGVDKRLLQGLIAWVDTHGSTMVDLAQRKQWPKQMPPTKADVKFAHRRLKAQAQAQAQAQTQTKGVLK